MGFVKRVSGLITANLNDLIDQCENPEKVLRQAVRDMEAALGQLMDGAARAIAHHKIVTRQLDEQQAAMASCTKNAEAAIARANEDAARSELLQKAEHRRFAEGLAMQVDSADALAHRLRQQVSAMRLKLAEARRKLAEVTARSRAAAAQRKFVDILPNDAASGQAWSSFEKMCARVEQSEAETEALIEILGETTVTETMDAEVEAELRALKEAASHVAC